VKMIVSSPDQGRRGPALVIHPAEEDSAMALVPGNEHLIAALRDKDRPTLLHSERAVDYACLLATIVGLKRGQITSLQRGGVLHDLGKLSIPLHILEKPAPLTGSEWDIVRRHPVDGHSRLAGRLEQSALDVVLFHHERFDGLGYPNHLRGEDIPILARVFCVADAYDAMTSDRPCRRAMTPFEAFEEIISCAGTQFDPILVEFFSIAFDTIAGGQESRATIISAPDSALSREAMVAVIPAGRENG
jgi:HD-GYP domain-containing protein (c-di-GMP phosphodiesterase class II)